MAKTSLDIDQQLVREASEILGTTTLRDTVNAALRDVVHANRRIELIGILASGDRIDFERSDEAWGGGS